MSLLVIGGLALIALGVAGVRYAPSIVEAQLERGMAPIDAEEIDVEDRVQVTKGAATLATVLGFGLVVYGVLY